MNAQITAYISLICLSGVLNLFLCIYVFIKRHTYFTVAHLFIAYIFTTTILCFSSASGLLATTLDQVKFWTNIQYVGIAFSPVLGLLFVLKYVNITLSTKVKGGLFLIPTLTFIMVITNDWHHLHYRLLELDPILGAPFVDQVEGPWYMVHGVFSFSCMMTAFLVACARWRETHATYKPQLLTLIIGQMIPIMVTFLYLINVTPTGVDPVPMVLWLTSLLYWWAIKSSRLFSVMPVAKDIIFNNMSDGVVVLNSTKHLVEYNATFEKMMPDVRQTMIGTSFTQIWHRITHTPSAFEFTTSSHTQIIKLHLNNKEMIYQIRILPLQHLQQETGYLMIFSDMTEIMHLQMQLKHQVYHDELTQIYNRRAFFEKCSTLLAHAQNNQTPFTILLLDIDHFKYVNDTYGHHIGDEVIKHIVDQCLAILPDDALFARYGGEEFVVALNGYSNAESMNLAHVLREGIANAPYNSLQVTISMGVALLHHERNETLQQLLNQADSALYTAKRLGRNHVHLYETTTSFSK